MNNKLTSIIVLVAALFVGAWLIYGNKNLVSNKPSPSKSPTPSATANKSDVTVATNRSSLGTYLTDGKGMTLYVFGNDKRLTSSCTGSCAETWPPFPYDNRDLKGTTDSLLKNLNVIKRSDGTYQYAWGEKPLYHYKGDSKPGDTNGNGINQVWSVILIK